MGHPPVPQSGIELEHNLNSPLIKYIRGEVSDSAGIGPEESGEEEEEESCGSSCSQEVSLSSRQSSTTKREGEKDTTQMVDYV